jgi:hypothetical protein
MSLVVAQATEEGPRIVSDTRVTFVDARRSSFKAGTLKAIVAAIDITICFSGDLHAGLDGVRRFARRLRTGETLDDLLPHLAMLTSEGERSVEFIIANAEAGSMLTRVRCGKIEENLQSAWIGDHDGFERFQEKRHRPVDSFRLEMMNGLPPGAQAMLALSDAMDAVIADPTIPSVGDFCVRVAAKQGEFNYLESTFVHVGRNITIRAGDNLVAKMAQPVEEGGYAVSVVQPAKPGTPALALNFPRAQMGMIYLPLEYDEAQVIQDVSPNDFAKAVFDRFGVAMSDPMLRYA